jgi:hypothetical protein
MTTDTRAAFEAQIKKQLPTAPDELLIGLRKDGRYASMVTEHAWLAHQAATLAERERCAKVCQDYSDEKWNLIQGATNLPRTEGMSIGAKYCADKIRKAQ